MRHMKHHATQTRMLRTKIIIILNSYSFDFSIKCLKQLNLSKKISDFDFDDSSNLTSVCDLSLRCLHTNCTGTIRVTTFDDAFDDDNDDIVELGDVAVAEID